MTAKPKRIVVLGSTGSIGRQTLDVVDSHPGSFEIVALAANSNWELLAQQIRKHEPEYAVLVDENRLSELNDAVGGRSTQLLSGQAEVDRLAALPDTDVVLNAVVGFAGLDATLAAVRAGKRIALANKESLVAGGELIERELSRSKAEIIPVDSEHSALFQCMKAGDSSEVKRLILTASGGPFLNKPLDEFDSITPDEALKHPNWDMGKKITIDSATMMNKALEIIEARWLFDVDPGKIDVVIHPQSVVHSMVEYVDSSVIAQMSSPDMRLPIRYALFYPERQHGCDGAIEFAKTGGLTFFAPDRNRFPAIDLAYRAMDLGGSAGAILNAANEIAVGAFLEGEIGFRSITNIVKQSLEQFDIKQCSEIDDIKESDRLARAYAGKLVNNMG